MKYLLSLLSITAVLLGFGAKDTFGQTRTIEETRAYAEGADQGAQLQMGRAYLAGDLRPS